MATVGLTIAAAVTVAGWVALRFVPPSRPPPPAPGTAAEPRAPVAAAPVPASPVAEPDLGFDVVRVAADGAALVAGRAAPGAAVALRVDEVLVAEVLADDNGQFVAIFALEPSAAPQVLTLTMTSPDGRVIAAPDVVVLAPRPAEPLPVEIARAISDPEPPPPPVAEAPPVPAPAPMAEVAPPESAPMAEAAPMPAAPPAEPAAATALPAPAPVIVAEPAPMAEAGPPESAPVAEAAPVPAAPPTELAAAVPAPAPGVVAEPAPVPEPMAEAEPPPAFVLRESGGVRLLDRAPQVLDNVVIDAIVYGADGEVQISGRARQGGDGVPLRLYLNNQPLAVARSDGGDWRLDLPHVDPGVYTLRVDELAPDGRVVSRFETPFLREDPAAVARLFDSQEGASMVSGPTEPSVTQAPVPPRAEDAVAATAGAADTVPGGAGIAPRTETAAPPQPGPGPAEAAPAAGPGTPTAVAEPIAAAPRPATPETAEADSPAALSAPPEPTVAVPPRPRVHLVTVQPGQSLWRISRDHYGAGELYVRIYRANRAQIRDPDLIYPGQIFAIPD